MVATQIKHDRITFSLPSNMNMALDRLKNELKRPKSEIIKLALEDYIKRQKKLQLEKAVQMMTDEYENNKELTEFTTLDSEEFL